MPLGRPACPLTGVLLSLLDMPWVALVDCAVYSRADAEEWDMSSKPFEIASQLALAPPEECAKCMTCHHTWRVVVCRPSEIFSHGAIAN